MNVILISFPTVWTLHHFEGFVSYLYIIK
jgi:hypothetical protein